MFLKNLHGIRGLAILFVVLYHFFPVHFPGGLMGVDIFFVLSGFLVTKSIIKNNTNLSGTKFLYDFYAKRIARILPMSLLLSTFAFLISIVYIKDGGFATAIKFYASSVLGFSNYSLYASTGNYFATGVDLNFLTQTWSLGIEEQFYFLLSIIILITILVRKKFGISNEKFLFIVILLSSVLSISLNAWFYFSNRGHFFSFFMIPSRWWELSSGCLISLYVFKFRTGYFKYTNTSLTLLFISFLVLISTLFISTNSSNFPFPLAFLPVIATSIFCYYSVIDLDSKQNGFIINRILRWPVLQWLGSVSFTLYLLHWIFLVFLRHTFGDNSLIGLIITLILVLVGSHFIHNKLEKPSNLFLRKTPRNAYILLIFSFTLLLFLFLQNDKKYFNKNPFNISKLTNVNYMEVMGKSEEEIRCHGKDKINKLKNPYKSCLGDHATSLKNHRVFINGDSHSAKLYLMIKKALSNYPYEVTMINTESAEDSYGFTRALPGLVKMKPMVFEYLVENAMKDDLVVLSFADHRMDRMDEDVFNSGREIWSTYINKLESKGVRILLILDTPTFENDISACIVSMQLLNNFFDTCSITIENAKKKRRLQEKLFSEMKIKYSNVFVWDIFPHFCDEKKCSMVEGGTLVYEDFNHPAMEKIYGLEQYFLDFLNQEMKIIH